MTKEERDKAQINGFTGVHVLTKKTDKDLEHSVDYLQEAVRVASANLKKARVEAKRKKRMAEQLVAQAYREQIKIEYAAKYGYPVDSHVFNLIFDKARDKVHVGDDAFQSAFEVELERVDEITEALAADNAGRL